MRVVCGLLILTLTAVTVSASNESKLDVGVRAKGAKKVVLATVSDVKAEIGENDYGDSLILSRVTMRVNETMKGAHEANVAVTIEGGTVGDLTLEVSDMPVMEEGDRAVVFLEDSKKGGYVPHRRGLGVMKVDENNDVEGTDMSIDDVRAAVKAAQGGK